MKTLSIKQIILHSDYRWVKFDITMNEGDQAP